MYSRQYDPHTRLRHALYVRIRIFIFCVSVVVVVDAARPRAPVLQRNVFFSLSDGSIGSYDPLLPPKRALALLFLRKCLPTASRPLLLPEGDGRLRKLYVCCYVFLVAPSCVLVY